MDKHTDILLLSGERSGDLLAAQLMDDIQAAMPNTRFAGMGSILLEQKGMQLLVDNRDISIIGIVGVIKKLPTLWRAWRTLKRSLITKPKLVILIDYPGFNLRFAKLAKRLGCPVVYYVSPQLWAWKPKRIHIIKKNVDHMAVLFNFEQPIYEQAGIPNTVVGHPICTDLPPLSNISNTAIKESLGFNVNKKLVVLCPGSRESEVTKHLPLLLDAQAVVKEMLPTTEFAILKSDSVNLTAFSRQLANIRIIENNQLPELFQSADAGLFVSGTITLQAALYQVPLVITYQLGAINYWLAKHLVKTPFIGLCNIVCQQAVAQEIIQECATAGNLAQAVIDCLDDPSAREKLAVVRDNIGETNHDELLQVVQKLIKPTPH